MDTQWDIVIGLEVHVQLNTQSKIFSGAATAFGAEPNTQACAIDLGLPGVLPVLNKEAVRKACQFGLAIDADIPEESVFARKNYFYPDLPKGYQISQYLHPIVGRGELNILLSDGTSKTVRIERAHLEEDAGKSLHEDFHGMSGIDLNRAGVPLLEIVSSPDLRSAEEAVIYLKTLHSLVTYLEICDGNLQEGSFRCDANVSVNRKGADKFGNRVEIKNVNSFRFVEKAIQYEANRQIQLLENGGSIRQETRLYDADKNETRTMRAKEEANDYRYFPDPDLLPVVISKTWLNDLKKSLPELPHHKCQRFQAEFNLSTYDATVLTQNKFLANFYEATIQHCKDKSYSKMCANWIITELLGALNKNNIELANSPISAKDIAELVNRIQDQTISGKIAKEIFESLWNKEGAVDQIIDAKGLKQVTDHGLIAKLIDEVIAENPEQVQQYREGKDKLFGFFVGQIMKRSGGKINPQQLNDLLKEKLSL